MIMFNEGAGLRSVADSYFLMFWCDGHTEMKRLIAGGRMGRNAVKIAVVLQWILLANLISEMEIMLEREASEISLPPWWNSSPVKWCNFFFFLGKSAAKRKPSISFKWNKKRKINLMHTVWKYIPLNVYVNLYKPRLNGYLRDEQKVHEKGLSWRMSCNLNCNVTLFALI